MTAILGAKEYCPKGHLRTPETTYVRPSGKRDCRVCSGRMPANSGNVSSLKGRPSKTFTDAELRSLRYLVRCVHCGAVPTEKCDEDGNAITRTVSDGRRGTLELPYIVTEHAYFCPSAKTTAERTLPTVDAGHCAECGAAMVAAKGRQKTYCDATCRTRAGVKARRTARNGATS